VWVSYLGVPGALGRIDLKTHLAEIYEPPFQNPAAKTEGYLPHGIDVDTNGVMWTGLNSGHLASFDRKKCKTPYNPNAARLGQQCVEGWTLYQAPGPNFKGVTESGSADAYYLNWVDQFDTSGLGKNTPFLNGSGSDAIMALVNAAKDMTMAKMPIQTPVSERSGLEFTFVERPVPAPRCGGPGVRPLCNAS